MRYRRRTLFIERSAYQLGERCDITLGACSINWAASCETDLHNTGKLGEPHLGSGIEELHMSGLHRGTRR
jgi:hypothetical protein